jgi:hypothetical protein
MLSFENSSTQGQICTMGIESAIMFEKRTRFILLDILSRIRLVRLLFQKQYTINF